MELLDFVSKYLNGKVDYDNAYGAQCVDLFRQYGKEVLDIPEHTGPVEGAADLWRKYLSLPKEKIYYTREANNQKAKPGYVAVWDKTPTNQYGHVAIVLADVDDLLLVAEQNGFTRDGVKLNYREKKNLLGYLVRR